MNQFKSMLLTISALNLVSICNGMEEQRALENFLTLRIVERETLKVIKEENIKVTLQLIDRLRLDSGPLLKDFDGSDSDMQAKKDHIIKNLAEAGYVYQNLFSGSIDIAELMDEKPLDKKVASSIALYVDAKKDLPKLTVDVPFRGKSFENLNAAQRGKKPILIITVPTSSIKQFEEKIVGDIEKDIIKQLICAVKTMLNSVLVKHKDFIENKSDVVGAKTLHYGFSVEKIKKLVEAAKELDNEHRMFCFTRALFLFLAPLLGFIAFS